MSKAKRTRLNAKALLDGIIALVRDKKDSVDELLQALRTVRKHAHELPPKVTEVLVNAVWDQIGYPALFAAPVPPQEGPERNVAVAAPSEAAPRGRTHFERIVAFFLSANNRPSSTFEIRRGTGLSRSALSVVLYKTHSASFERTAAPGYERLNVWKMRDEKFEALTSGPQEVRLSA